MRTTTAERGAVHIKDETHSNATPFQGPPSSHDEILIPPGLRRRHSVRSAVTLVPPLVAGLASFTLGDLDAPAAARGAVLAAAILATAGLLRSFPYPVRLMPASRAVLAVAPVLAGAFVAGMLAISDAYGLAATSLIPATVLAAAAALGVEYVGGNLLARRPLRVAVLGSPEFAAGLQRELDADGVQPVVVVGWLNLGAPRARAGALQIGTLDSIRSAVTEHEIDLLVRGPSQSLPDGGRRVYDAIAQGCVDLPVRMITGNQLYEQLFGHVPLGKIDSDWFLFLMHPSFESTARLPKRAFDLITAAAASIVALPLITIAAIVIRLEGGGSVFYRQIRVGEGGRRFEIVKLRTMKVNAEGTAGAQWSAAADDRVTRVGRVLRRSHIDELPQLLNVFRGEMTMVGPRPERPEIVDELEDLFPHYKRRLLVKPGVTGWAQVRCGYAGSELGTAWKLCHDLFYLKHRGLLSDSLIMLETLLIAAKDSHRKMRAPLPEFLVDSDRLDASVAPAGVSPGPESDDAWVAETVPEISLDGGSSRLGSGAATFAVQSPPER